MLFFMQRRQLVAERACLLLVALCSGIAAILGWSTKQLVIGRYYSKREASMEGFELDAVLNREGTMPIIARTNNTMHFILTSRPATEEILQAKQLKTSVPQLDDQETVLNFAKMSSNAYATRSLQHWHPLPSYEENLDDFGWEGDGLRGYIFTNPNRSIVIVAFKGTSTILSGGKTIARDKWMDNLMFSCCCARVDASWSPVCGCYVGGLRVGNICNQQCLEEAARAPNTYYTDALKIYEQARQKHPRAIFWFTGHSMGGAVAALLAATVPRTSAVTFESPGALLYASRLGLARDVEHRVWNFGLSTDPIFTGDCVGVVTTCYLSGYAVEAKCRHGLDCMYRLPGELDLSSHRIDWIIDKILTQQKPPPCSRVVDCHDCQHWAFT